MEAIPTLFLEYIWPGYDDLIGTCTWMDGICSITDDDDRR